MSSIIGNILSSISNATSRESLFRFYKDSIAPNTGKIAGVVGTAILTEGLRRGLQQGTDMYVSGREAQAEQAKTSKDEQAFKTDAAVIGRIQRGDCGSQGEDLRTLADEALVRHPEQFERIASQYQKCFGQK